MDSTHIALIISIFTTVAAVAGMQFKSMKYVIVSQLLANGLLGLQYILEGRINAGGIVFLAIVQTVVGFILTYKKIDFPVWLTIIFIVGYTAVAIIGYTSPFDILSCVAVWFFAIGIVQKRSSICRACSAINTILWLIYDIALAPSGIVTHSVILVFIIVGIIRLDRGDWAAAFRKIASKLGLSKKNG